MMPFRAVKGAVEHLVHAGVVVEVSRDDLAPLSASPSALRATARATNVESERPG